MRAVLIFATLLLFFAVVSGQTDVMTTTAASVTAKPTSFMDRLKSNAASLGNKMKEGAKQFSQTVQTKLSELGTQMG